MNDQSNDRVDALDSRLRSTAALASFPPTPDLVRLTRARIAADRPAVGLSMARYVWTGGIAVILALVLVFTFSTSSREAIGRWFDIPGIRIVGDDGKSNGVADSPIRSMLGAETSLEAVADAMSFDVMTPESLVAPDEVYRLTNDDSDVLTMIWQAKSDLPAIGDSDIALLFSQFRSSPDEVWADKEIGGTASMRVVRVHGVDGLWIEGTHDLTINDTDGDPQTRAAGNVLTWHIGGVTYRIESNLPLDRVLAIAESIVPLPELGT